MDTDVCGLNKVRVKQDMISNGMAEISDKENPSIKWEKNFVNGWAEFYIPSIPAPGKHTYLVTFKNSNGQGYAKKYIELGFGDSVIVADNATSSDENCLISPGGCIRETANLDNSGYKSVTIDHTESGVVAQTYGEYGSVPEIRVNKYGHITYAKSNPIPFVNFTISPRFKTKQTITSGSTVYIELTKTNFIMDASSSETEIDRIISDVIDYPHADKYKIASANACIPYSSTSVKNLILGIVESASRRTIIQTSGHNYGFPASRYLSITNPTSSSITVAANTEFRITGITTDLENSNSVAI